MRRLAVTEGQVGENQCLTGPCYPKHESSIPASEVLRLSPPNLSLVPTYGWFRGKSGKPLLCVCYWYF
jgi:hypothetical protein